MTESPLVLVENLTIAFGPNRVVTDLRLSIDQGARLALVGESGSGKTVTALAMAGLLPPEARTTGRIVWSTGNPVPGRDYGLVLQDPMSSLNPVLDLGEQIGEVLETHSGLGRRSARKAAVDLLAAVGIPEPQTRVRAYPHQHSGGQRQRVALAIAIAAGPKMLIADEPTTALDTVVQAGIVRLIDRLTRERGMGLLLITHDLALASTLTDECVVLYAGRLVERGAMDTILHAPRHPYTQGLLAASLDFDSVRKGRLPEISGTQPAPDEIPAGCPFAPRCPEVRDACRQRFPAWIGSERDGVACVLHDPRHRP